MTVTGRMMIAGRIVVAAHKFAPVTHHQVVDHIPVAMEGLGRVLNRLKGGGRTDERIFEILRQPYWEVERWI